MFEQLRYRGFFEGSPGITHWRSYSSEEHFASLCLFVKTSPVNLPVTSGNGNKFFTKTDTFKLKITLDRHNLRLNLNDDLFPDPSHFLRKLEKTVFLSAYEVSTVTNLLKSEKRKVRA
jgi:hypothetical protein